MVLHEMVNGVNWLETFGAHFSKLVGLMMGDIDVMVCISIWVSSIHDLIWIERIHGLGS